MESRIIRRFAIALAALLLAPVTTGFAQNAAYPSRPVRFIIPFPPGGGTDIVGRLVGEALSTSFGQTFVMDNRPGAASTLGSAIAAQAAPDGYTILMMTASYTIAANYYRKLPYDPVKSFDAVSMVASQPLVLVTNPTIRAMSVGEFIAHAKANPGKLNYASGGEGGINHLAAEMFKSNTGTTMVHVPYKGAGPALRGLMGGETHLMFATLGSALSHVRAGRLKAIGIGGPRRSELLPGVATISESGVSGYEAQNWYGVLVPRGTHKTTIGELNKRIVSALKAKDLVSRLAKLAFDPAPSTPGQFSQYLKKEIAKWGRAMADAGVRRK